MIDGLIIPVAYLIGSIPLAYLVGLLVKRIDIRLYGSGNVGTSNIWIHVGKLAAIPLACFDIFIKGVLPLYLARQLSTDPWIIICVGLAAIVGHNWSLYIKFTGGRGILVATGVLLVLAWKELLALLLVGVIGWLLFRNTALWVGISFILIPVWSILFADPMPITVLCVGIVVLLAVKRLLSNPVPVDLEISFYKLMWHRLLYDRDVSNRTDWVYRTPDSK